MTKRPTVHEYEEYLRTADVRPGKAPEAFRGADVRVSIVLPVLNCERTLEAAFESALKQAGNPEIVVVDGGSSDETLAIIERYEGRIHRWISEPDESMYDALNKGVALSTGRIVHLLNGDDLLTDDSVQIAQDHFRDRADEHCLRGALGCISVDGKMREVLTRRNKPRFASPALPILHPAWYVPRAIYERVGLYLPYFRIAGDHEYAHHLWKTGIEFVNVPDVLALFREGGLSMTRVGLHETLETNAIYLGRSQAAAIYGSMLMKKGRRAALEKLLGPERRAALWKQLKRIRGLG